MLYTQTNAGLLIAIGTGERDLATALTRMEQPDITDIVCVTTRREGWKVVGLMACYNDTHDDNNYRSPATTRIPELLSVLHPHRVRGKVQAQPHPEG